jgi:hypothetical protein
MRLRRPLALFTALAVGWAALWPLVAAARALATPQVEFLCHQAGTQVPLDRAPMAPAEPGSPAEPRQHCPLCVFSFLGAFAEPIGALAQPPAARPAPAAYCAPSRGGLGVVLPQGRAPPVLPR